MTRLLTTILIISFLRVEGQNFNEKCGVRILHSSLNKDKNSLTYKKSMPLIHQRKEASIYIVPIVFHLVMKDPNQVSDDQIKAQILQLNKDWSGQNSDTGKIESHFKSSFGKGKIQFCLAQKSTNQQIDIGIERFQSTTTSIVKEGDPVKHANAGGANAWDTKRFINVWIVDKMYPASALGYGSYPNLLPSTEDGIVILASTLPGGVPPNHLGRTLTHEMGHYFNLFHLWEPFGCVGSDFPGTENLDDTPFQNSPTWNCPNGILLSECNPEPSTGKYYQDFMDYPDDECILMFTTGQVRRAELTLLNYRSELLEKNTCLIAQYNKDGISVSPNPTTTFLYIQHLQPRVDLQGISIMNAAGQIVYRQQFFRTALTYIPINVANLAPGVYNVRLDYANKTINQKFLKM